VVSGDITVELAAEGAPFVPKSVREEIDIHTWPGGHSVDVTVRGEGPVERIGAQVVSARIERHVANETPEILRVGCVFQLGWRHGIPHAVAQAMRRSGQAPRQSPPCPVLVFVLRAEVDMIKHEHDQECLGKRSLNADPGTEREFVIEEQGFPASGAGNQVQGLHVPPPTRDLRKGRATCRMPSSRANGRRCSLTTVRKSNAPSGFQTVMRTSHPRAVFMP